MSALRERVAVRQNGRVFFITLDEIDWIEAADNYICLHCGVETHVLRFRGDYHVILRDGTTLILTKKHREKLDSHLLLGSFTR
jgi:hypothetical protein